MTEKKYIVLTIIMEIVLAAVAFFAGYFAYRMINRENGEFPIVFQVYEILKENAFDPLPDKRAIEYEMIRGMLRTTNDPHTSFFEPPQTELHSDTLEGKFGGIGARLERLSDNRVYLYPIPDSPASKAGLQDGDELIQVGNLVLSPETTLDQIQAAIRGPVGEAVEITVKRGEEKMTFSVERKEFGIPSVTWNLLPTNIQVGVVHVSVIAATSAQEIDAAITDLTNKGARYFILDLRNNGGGLVEGGVEVARLFMKEGVIFEQQYRGKEVEEFTVDQMGKFANLPLVVLVNQNTASAAEMIAGALKGSKRASLMGTPTYGKNSIQLVFELTDGSSVHVTAARWWIPALSTKEAVIQPDVELSGEIANNDSIYDYALVELLK